QDPKESITQFIARLDSSADQLCLLGVGILDNVIKRRLYDGLLSDRLRDKVDRDVDDHRVDYTEFKRLLVKYDRRKKTSSRSTKKEVDPATLRLYGGRLPDQRHNATVNHIMGIDTVEEDQDIEHLPGSNPLDDDTYYVYAVVRDQQSITCYRCLQDGHPARDCTNDIGKKDDRCSRCGNPTHGIDKCNVSITATCHRCGRQGHLAYVCPDPLPTSTSRNKGSKGKGKASSKGKGKSSGTAQATTSSTTTDLPTSAPTTPNVKTSGIDPNDHNDAPEESSDEDIPNDNQTNTITMRRDTSSLTTATETISNCIQPCSVIQQRSENNGLSTLKSCSSSKASTGCDIVVGIVKIGPETRPVLFDTGADISLIAIGTLQKILGTNCPTFPKKTQSNVKVANTDSMQIIGFVSLPVQTKHIKINERFAVTGNTLSSPVILGCPALQQLQCAIVFTVTGPIVFTGIEDLSSSFHSQIYKTISKSARGRKSKTASDADEVSITHQPTTHAIRILHKGDITATCSTTRLSDTPPHPDPPPGDTGTIGDPPDEAIDDADELETNVITGLRVSKKYLEDDIDSDDINWPVNSK
ncbi:hypothetical protein FOZ62_005156, partial [Perkinsus olseni]